MTGMKAFLIFLHPIACWVVTDREWAGTFSSLWINAMFQIGRKANLSRAQYFIPI